MKRRFRRIALWLADPKTDVVFSLTLFGVTVVAVTAVVVIAVTR